MMIPCKHLDYNENYAPGCELMNCSPDFPEVRFWFRHVVGYPEAPRKVQFCKLRGRINGIFQCYQESEMCCYEEDAMEEIDE
jgi:hypothetical protein